MATISIQFSCLFLVILFTCSQIDARNSRFFSNYVHLSTNNYVTVPSTVPKPDRSSSSPSTAPSPAPITSQISDAPPPIGAETGYKPSPAPALAPLPVESIEDSSNYYGLYGKGDSSDQIPYETTNKESNEDEFSSEEFSNENFNKLNSKEAYNYYNNYKYDNRYSNLNTERYDTNVRPQGMSDTRSLENGKYYYDIQNENYNPNIRYEAEKSSNEEGYYSRQKSKYEFDSMEEYERKEGYPDIQRDQYIP